MKKTKILPGAMLALGLLSTGCSQSPAIEAKTNETKPAGTVAADTLTKDIADITALEDRFIAAFRAKDVNAIMTAYVPDESLVVFDVVPPRQYVGAQAYRKDFEELLSLYPGPLAVEISDLKVTVGGDVAFGHNIQHGAGTMKDGKKLDWTVRVTDGYKKVNGQWLIAHEHISVPVDLLTGRADLASKP